MAPPTAAGSQRGIAFLSVLLMVAAMSAALAAGGTLWHEIRLREKESELLFVGMQYRNAIRLYYEGSPGQKKFPPALEHLLLDPRLPSVKRYLRKPYADPLTNSPQWGLITAPEGGIAGVYSLAPGEPVRRSNFPALLNWSGPKSSYSNWEFVYRPEMR